ncbi:sigma 54-interacting transcriptional regulator [Carboxydocella sporoproducens]
MVRGGDLMKPKIAVTSSYPELTTLFRRVSEEMATPAIVVEAVLEEAVQKLQEVLNQHKIEVIISRGGTAETLKKNFSIPVINADATDFDILQAFWKARKVSHHIGFFTYDHARLESDFLAGMEEIIGCPIRQFIYSNIKELQEQIIAAKKSGVEVVVGGGNTGVQLAQKAGMHGVLVYTSRRAVVRAFQRALEIIELRQKDLEQTQWLKTIIDHAFDGIVALNQEREITVFNPAAEKILGLPREKVLSRSADTLVSTLLPAPLLMDGTEETEKVLRLGDAQIVFNRVPIMVEGQNIGMVITFQDVTRVQRLEQRIRKELYNKGLISRFNFDDIVYCSSIMEKTIERAKQFGRTDSTVLIIGESGTGKELFAHSMHAISDRRKGPFVAINCAALPENLLESELFGYEEGAFTGARKGGKPGLFELAHGGTIFLDEIGKISLNLQARLLRVLQEKEVRRVGGDRIIPVDVRVISAANEDLNRAVQNGEFRSDLYFRLNVLNLKIPPLRERKEDIPVLINHFLNKFNRKFDKKVTSIPSYLKELMLSYSWPGNVRELENIIERYVILEQNNQASKELECYFKETFQQPDRSEVNCWQGDTITVREGTLEEMELEIIRKLDAKMNGNRTLLAQKLGISRTTLWKKLKEF